MTVSGSPRPHEGIATGVRSTAPFDAYPGRVHPDRADICRVAPGIHWPGPTTVDEHQDCRIRMDSDSGLISPGSNTTGAAVVQQVHNGAVEVVTVDLVIACPVVHDSHMVEVLRSASDFRIGHEHARRAAVAARCSSHGWQLGLGGAGFGLIGLSRARIIERQNFARHHTNAMPR